MELASFSNANSYNIISVDLQVAAELAKVYITFVSSLCRSVHGLLHLTEAQKHHLIGVIRDVLELCFNTLLAGVRM